LLLDYDRHKIEHSLNQ